MSLQRIPHDSMRYQTNPVELLNISQRQRIGYSIDSYTKLLLHMDGTNNSTSFIDECGKTVTPYGDAKISTGQSKFGGSSAYFDGTGDHLKTTSSMDFYLYGDFTLEAWVYPTASKIAGALICLTDDTGYFEINIGLYLLYPRFTIYHTSAYQVEIQVSTPLNLNTWNHIMAVRYGDVHSIYVNGSIGASITKTHTIPSSSLFCYIGYIGSTNNDNYRHQGYIDEARISNGISICKSNFIPQTSQYRDYHNYIGA